MNINRQQQNFLDRLQAIEQMVFTAICPKLAARKRAFIATIKQIFEYAIISGKVDGQFEWSFVKTVYNEIKSDLGNFCALRIFCAFVLKLFYIFDCEYDQFIIKKIYMYHQVMNKYETLGFCENCMLLNYPKHYPYEDLEDARPILRKVNGIIENTYKFSNREFYSKLTTDAIYEGDYVLLQFLVKYGLSYFPTDELKQAKIELEEL